MDNTVIAALNELLETSRDGELGFKRAAEEVKEPQLKSMFLKQAQQCQVAARELAAQITALGGSVEEGGSVTGALHRGWVNVKAAMTGHDTLAVLEETERGEDYAKKVYTEALELDLPIEVRQMIERQYRGVITNHDDVRDVRDTYRSKN
ncbi:MAG: PA2169 family four-helix-bundle protein [Steroidobacteraceae bacterium]